MWFCNLTEWNSGRYRYLLNVSRYFPAPRFFFLSLVLKSRIFFYFHLRRHTSQRNWRGFNAQGTSLAATQERTSQFVSSQSASRVSAAKYNYNTLPLPSATQATADPLTEIGAKLIQVKSECFCSPIKWREHFLFFHFSSTRCKIITVIVAVVVAIIILCVVLILVLAKDKEAKPTTVTPTPTEYVPPPLPTGGKLVNTLVC